MSTFSHLPEPQVLLDGLAMVESPRWHDGRLWFAHWGTGEIRAVDLGGRSEVVGHGPEGLGWTFDWLPDDRLLVTGKELLCAEPGALGGPERKTLFLLAAQWLGPDHVADLVAERTGQVLTVQAPASGTGWP